MAGEQIHVTPAVITWARKRAGFSVAEARESFKKIEAWEDGNSFPTYPQLEQLADKFKIPIAVFFFPAPPDVPPIRESFRTLPEPQFEEIPREVRLLLRKAKALQLNLAELNDGRNPAQRLITRDLSFATRVSINDMGRQVREYLGVTLEEQCAWSTNVEALENWRQVLSDVGIFVFKDAFKIDDYSGFCLYDEAFPIIYVNNSSTKTRQIFTLFHELAHLMFHTSGIDTRADEYIPALVDDAQRIEILCNRFAARFLVPEEAFEVASKGKPISEDTAAELAKLFNVSRTLIFRIYLDRGLIDDATYTQAALTWDGQRGEGTGGNWYNTKIAYLGRNYINLAFRHYYQNRIDETQLAEYLDTKPRNLNALEEHFARGSA